MRISNAKMAHILKPMTDRIIMKCIQMLESSWCKYIALSTNYVEEIKRFLIDEMFFSLLVTELSLHEVIPYINVKEISMLIFTQAKFM